MCGATWSWSVRKSSICWPSPKYTASRSLSEPGAVEAGFAAQPRVVAAERDGRRPQRRVTTEVRALQRDLPRVRPVLLHREVAHVRVVADDELDDGVDEVVAADRREAVDDRDLRAVTGDHQRVREAGPALAL